MCNVRVQSKVALTSADCHSLLSFSMRSLLKLFFAFCVFFIFNAIFALHKVGVVRCDEVLVLSLFMHVSARAAAAAGGGTAADPVSGGARVVLMICYRRGSAMMAIVDAVRSSMADCGGGSCVGGVALRSRSECAHLADFEVFCRSKD